MIVWQHPYVNAFKHFQVQEWKKASKEGEVTSLMDRTLKGTVYKISGSIPAGNYIQLPKTGSQSLGLTGRYMYLLFKPIPSKYFVVHIDVATHDGLIVRISFSNLFKEFKSTSTWLQFPFICHAAKGSISDKTAVGSRDHSGPAPMNTRWTALCLDFQYILSLYLNRHYSYLKSIRMCANIMVKNIFTSDMEYEPGLTFDEVKKSKISLQGIAPMPREMQFPLGKLQKWHDVYDLIKFPSDTSNKPFDSVQYTKVGSDPQLKKSSALDYTGPKRVNSKVVSVSAKKVADRQSNIVSITSQNKPYKKKEIVRELPRIGVTEDGEVSVNQTSDGEVHVYAHAGDPVAIHVDRKKDGGKAVVSKKVSSVSMQKEENYTSLKPDPILKLKRIVGFGGTSTRDALWTKDGSAVIYPCHAVVVVMQASNGHQRFFIGHTDKVACIAQNGNSTLLASGQTGQQSVVRVWKFTSGECLAMFKTHAHSLHCLSMSHSGSVLGGVGKDNHGKNMVVIWSTEAVNKGGQVNVIAKAHTDVDIVRMRIAFFDDTRMVSCGRDNIRLWRVKDGQLRSAPVNLGEYHQVEVTDCCFEAGYEATKDPLDRVVYACSKSGHIFEVDYRKVAISNVRRLLPAKADSDNKGKSTVASGSGIALNCMTVNEAFCVTGSDDGYLRLWPLDFKHVYLEAEHEGPVTAVDISNDGVKILAGTSTGNVGILDVSTRGYTTIMRSHTRRVVSMSMDPVRRHMATVSEDHTIRVWDLDTMQQLYDFSAPKECPSSIVYHPQQQVFACGFESGSVRVFNVTTTSLIAEHRQHRGRITGLAYSPRGDYLYSSGSLGALALYDATENKYRLLRVLANTVARGDKFGPNGLVVSPDGRFVAFVGPSDFTVSVVESRSLDEVMRIDISCVNTTAGDIASSRANIDTALRVAYSTSSIKQLLVTTSNNKLIKFDARNGKLLTEVEHVHRSGCTALHVSQDGRHLCTAGDRVIKIWDYHMRLDLNFQVFIGHAESISQVYFAPDDSTFVSTGEGIFIWDFLANRANKHVLEGRTTAKSYYSGKDEEFEPYGKPAIDSVIGSELDGPRSQAPKPFEYEPGNCVANLSNIDRLSNNDQLLGEEIMSQTSEMDAVSERLAEINMHKTQYQTYPQNDESLSFIEREMHKTRSANTTPKAPHRHCRNTTPTKTSRNTTPIKHHHHTSNSKSNTPTKSSTKRRGHNRSKENVNVGSGEKSNTDHPQPTIYKHYVQREKSSSLAQRRFTAPPNQAGLKLKSVIGYNGNGRDNMVWNPDTGMFAYSSGCIVVIEDLSAGTQQHLMGHHEEVSTLALQSDCQVLASASGEHDLSPSQIILWDLHTMTCKKVLKHHKHSIVCMAYSRDDRFLISVGDYRDCEIVVWSTFSQDVITTTTTTSPIHSLKWDPYMCNEFSAVGSNGTVLFWLLDETGDSVAMNVHEAEVPKDVIYAQHGGSVEFTAMEYAGDSTLYIGTSSGHITAWDTRQNVCFLHWEADSQEIDVLVSKNNRLISGGCSKNLKMWSTSAVGDMRGENPAGSIGNRSGLTMEDEMNLDGFVVSAAFDETMDMGIVGTSAGTLWYINWAERASIRLVSGHKAKVTDVCMCGDQLLATCCEDGSLRVWSIKDREQTLQFQVLDQPCNCIAFAPPAIPRLNNSTATSANNMMTNTNTSVNSSDADRSTTRLPNIVAGYGDGTVRMFDLNKVEMVLKMHPHAAAVTAITFSSDGRMILSGASDGLVAVSSPTTGMTVRVISDHKGAPIACLDVTFLQEQELSFSAPQLWLAASADRRVSVWSADWSKDFCELVDWLTFPAPAFAPDGSAIDKGNEEYYKMLPPTIAKFSNEEPDVVVYVGYGMQKSVQFYSLTERKVLRSINLTHWATCLDVCPSTPLIAVGNSERLLKLTDYYEGSFQDFVGHDDSITLTKFSTNGKYLFSLSHTELLMWETTI